uniref:RAS protein activator like-3 n=1 Tax=Capra hircus TaxID=9925 RepID=A0A8C2NUW0_CAPHI
MDPPSPSQASQTQPAAPSPLTSYRWHSGGGGEKGAGGFRWGRLAGWGRAQSHQETTASSQPAPRSLFRRVLSAPAKESRTSRLKISKSLWGKNKSPPLDSEPEPENPEPAPELEPLAAQIPEAPTPDVPVWNIEAFTLLDGKLVLLGNEEEGPRQPRIGSASSESSIQVALGNLKDPDRTPGKTEPEAAGPHQIHNVRGLLKRLKEKKKANKGNCPPRLTLWLNPWPQPYSWIPPPQQVTWAGGSRCFSCRSAAERDRWIEDLRRHFQPSQVGTPKVGRGGPAHSPGPAPSTQSKFLSHLGTAELARSGGREALLFRENTLATKAIDEYMKLVAQDYLQETLGQVVRRLCASTEDCEVDPSKCPASDLPQHQSRLRNSCKEVFENIIHSYNWFPAELGTVFSGWREACKARGSEALGPRLVCASLFLRLLCPAILSPSLFGLASEHPAPGPARTLTLIAKVIQNLANRAPFGEKEAYMSFMNSFLEDHGPAMQHFLDQVAMVDADTAPSGYQGSSDLALQLAVLHHPPCMLYQATRDNLEPLPTILHAIEEGRPVPVTVPMCFPAPHTQGHSSISAGEKPGFLAPRDLPKHTPLISKSQPNPTLSEPQFSSSVQLERHYPIGRAVRRQSKRNREVTVAPSPQLAELQCEVAALRQDLKMLSGLVESLSTHIRSLSEQQEQLRTQLQLLDSRLREGTVKLDPGRDPSTNESHRLKSLECRLAEIESTQAQLKDTIQNLQLLPRTSESQTSKGPVTPCLKPTPCL